ncbi:hypothetical protein PG994_006630 [Apiospora phragmitis]|uniref:Uncharacterized protein n=1 Tax=Apiospora phragmitis TaxID=2905665 RepID=A0ABR1VFL7_9PEZI
MWNRYVQSNWTTKLHGRVPLSIQVGKHKVKLLINQGLDLVCIRPDMNKKWGYDTSFADIIEFLSPPTADATRHVAFEYEPDLNGRSFDAKVTPAPPSLPGQAPRRNTWLEFFGGKTLHTFRRSRGAILSGNEPAATRASRGLRDQTWCTFYLVNNSDINTFYPGQSKASDIYFLAKGKAYRVQGKGRPPLDRIRKAALEEEYGPAREWPEKGIKPRLTCRLLMLWPTREMAPPQRNRGNNLTPSWLERQRRWFNHPGELMPMFPADM